MQQNLKAVSIGGGTGQPRAIAALRALGASIDSVVAMADDGGSTGILRERAGALPPGDIRQCLSALALDPDAPLARAFASRLPYLDNHALGNLVLVALAAEAGSLPDAISICEELLGCVGHVHPSTLEPVTLTGVTATGERICGQAQVSYGAVPCVSAHLDQDAPAADAGAVRAILEADLVVLGPGSLFTSIAPNLEVPGIVEALFATDAVRVFVCPKIDSLGETRGMSVADHVEYLLDHGLAGKLDAVLVHRASAPEEVYPYAADADAPAPVARGGVVSSDDIARAKRAPFGPIRAGDEELDRIGRFVPHVLVRDFTGTESPAVHDVRALADALAEAVRTCRSALR